MSLYFWVKLLQCAPSIAKKPSIVIMSATSINSLSEFLLQAGTEYLVYDMGRGIVKLDNQQFLDLENNQLRVERARAGHAWYGIVFWNKQLSHEHYIWFVKLPVDENMLLSAAARNQFLEIVVTALGQGLEHKQDPAAQLPDNPFIFQPSQQQLADFNAISRVDIGLPAREGVQTVLQYLRAPSIQEWSQMSLQNIADTAANFATTELSELLISNLHVLPEQVLLPLLSSLEHQSLPSHLTNSLIELYDLTDEVSLQYALLRAISACADEHQKLLFVQHVIQQDKIDAESLVIIAGRYWQVLAQPEALQVYLQRVAVFDPSFALFSGLYTDLVHLPLVRSNALALLRQAEKPRELTQAIGYLFNSMQQEPR